MKTQMVKKATKLIGMSLLSLYFVPSANAQTTATAPAAGTSAFAQCAEKNNITLPVKGSGQRLSVEQRHEIWSCVKAERKTAFQGCAAQNNITLPQKGSGQRLSKAEHVEIKQCMTSLGFKSFHHHHRSVTPAQAPQAS